jgi:hypothetical protein
VNFTVKWHRRATRQLADAYLAARTTGQGATVTLAAERIDRLLAVDPDNQGESRSGDYRFLFVAPLAVYFVVKHQRRLVVVHNVRYQKPRRR